MNCTCILYKIKVLQESLVMWFIKEHDKGKGSVTGNEEEKSQERIYKRITFCTFHIIYIYICTLLFCMISPPCFILSRILCHACDLYVVVVAVGVSSARGSIYPMSKCFGLKCGVQVSYVVALSLVWSFLGPPNDPTVVATEVFVDMNIMICKKCFHVVKINQIKFDLCLCFFLSWLHISVPVSGICLTQQILIFCWILMP